MTDIFIPGLVSVEQVEQIYRDCLLDLSARSVVSSWTSEGTSVTKVIPMPAVDLMGQCIQFLRRVAPEKYGRKVSVTHGYFI